MTHSYTSALSGRSPGLPDPELRPEFYNGLAFKRFMAWLVDLVLVGLMVGLAVLLTIGIGLFFLPVIWAIIDFCYRVISLSGNDSTLDPLGYQTVRLSVETRGGTIDNMWGPRGSERWRYHDTISHPEKLRGTAVYMSAGNGVIGPEDPGEYGSERFAMWFGIVLERGVNEATKAFSRALDEAGVEHRADYGDTGLHNWATFMRYFDAGWEHIKPSLQA